jgi:hypothetical protein
MSRNSKKVSVARLLAMMTEMWSDIRKGKTDANRISVSNYAKRYHVSKFKLSIIVPYIVQKQCPTYEQAVELRKAISNYINQPMAEKKPEPVKADLFGEEVKRRQEAIEQAITLLQENGYLVFRRVEKENRL